MTNDEIETLRLTDRRLKKAGGKEKLCWQSPRGPLHIVSTIAPPPKEEVPEPSDCAYLQEGGYVALWNAEFDTFGIITFNL